MPDDVFLDIMLIPFFPSFFFLFQLKKSRYISTSKICPYVATGEKNFLTLMGRDHGNDIICIYNLSFR
jgi:hypothetical protein